MTTMSQAGSASGLEAWVPFSRTMSTWSVRRSFLPPAGSVFFHVCSLSLYKARELSQATSILSLPQTWLQPVPGLTGLLVSLSHRTPSKTVLSGSRGRCSTSPTLQGLMSRSGGGEGICRLLGDAGVIRGPQFMNHCHTAFKHDLIYINSAKMTSPVRFSWPKSQFEFLGCFSSILF